MSETYQANVTYRVDSPKEVVDYKKASARRNVAFTMFDYLFSDLGNKHIISIREREETYTGDDCFPDLETDYTVTCEISAVDKHVVQWRELVFEPGYENMPLPDLSKTACKEIWNRVKKFLRMK